MKPAERIRMNRESILAAWRKLIMGTYPEGGGSFFAREKDQFRNPIGSIVATATNQVFDALVADAGRDALEAGLDPLIRMRAVQDFLPSQAVGFVLDLKSVVRDAMGKDEDLRAFGESVDAAALVAFDLYVACRVKASELKVTMMRDRSYMLMKRAGMLWEEPDGDETPAGPNSAKRGEAI